MEIGQLITDFGFPIVMAVGMGYFVYFVYQTILTKVDPAVEDMKITIIRLIDQLRLLDQDMIRLQEKVNTVLEMKENEKKLDSEQNSKKEVYGGDRPDSNDPSTWVSGTINLEGNSLTWINNCSTITLIIEEYVDGVLTSTTEIVIPIGSFGGCWIECDG